jgi:hypothetical protein
MTSSQGEKKKGVRHPPRSRQIRAFRAGRPFVIDAPGPEVGRQTHSGLRGGRTRRQRALPKNSVWNQCSSGSIQSTASDLNGCCLERHVGEPDSFRMSYQPPISQLATALTSRFSQCQTMKGVRHPPRSRQIRAFRAGRPFAIEAPGPEVGRQPRSGLRGGRTRRQRALPKNSVWNQCSSGSIHSIPRI